MNNTTSLKSFGPAERIAAEWACTKLVYEFGRLVDARDYQAVVQLFDEEAEFNRPSEPDKIIRGRQQLLANFKTRPNYVSTHLFSNVQVTADGPEHAAGHSYLMMYTSTPDNIGPLGVPTASAEARIGAFAEEFVRRDGSWLFRRRVGRMLMVTQGAVT
jgi:hypothetical protein